MFVRKTKCSLMSSGIKKYDFYRKAIDGLQTKSVTTLNVESQLGSLIDSSLDISFMEMSCDSGTVYCV